jgi:hypothetical protein
MNWQWGLHPWGRGTPLNSLPGFEALCEIETVKDVRKYGLTSSHELFSGTSLLSQTIDRGEETECGICEWLRLHFSQFTAFGSTEFFSPGLEYGL